MSAIITNYQIYLEIAEAAQAESIRIRAVTTRPKPDGSSGAIISWDPERKAFKQSLIAIAFSGMYLEAVVSLVATTRFGADLYKKIDRNTNYEDKLRLLGIQDPLLLNACKRFREARNELVHEKAAPLDTFTSAEHKDAETEARLGLAFVTEVGMKLRP